MESEQSHQPHYHQRARAVPSYPGNGDESPDQQEIQGDQEQHAGQTGLLSYGRSYEVRVCVGQKSQSALCSIGQTFPEWSPGTDCYHGLNCLISKSPWVDLIRLENGLDSFLLIAL